MNLLTLAQISAQTGYEPSWLRREAERGNLKASKLGKTWLVRPGDLARFLASPNRRKATLVP